MLQSNGRSPACKDEILGQEMDAGVKDLGDLRGPILVWGGAYSNLQATRAVLDWAEAAGFSDDQRVFTGDAVGYCANPSETWDLVAARGGHLIAGNVERQLAEGATDCGCGFAPGSACDALAKGWYPFADTRIDSSRRAAMAALPDVLTFSMDGKRVAVLHGGASDVARFLFSASEEAAFVKELGDLERHVGGVDLVLAGHSGIAFARDIGSRRWINAGAVGLPPNDGKPGGQFAVLDGDRVSFHRIAYDAATAAGAMRRAGLDQGYDRALETGFWPSEDVLPAPLRRRPKAPSLRV